MTEIHAAAQIGFSHEAESYARGRPDYSNDLLEWLSGDLGIGAHQVVVDLGAGTGKFTKLLAQTGADVYAVEPIEAMRLQLARNVSEAKILPGIAEAIPLETCSVDAVVCAQAFHWFATDAALREIHRVLRPNGRLGLIWYVRDESLDWVAAIKEIITPYEGNTPRFYKDEWRRPFSGEYFSPLELTTFEYQHTGKPQHVILDRFLSVSFIAALPAVEKEKVADKLKALIDAHPALRNKESVALPYRTEAYKCARLETSRTQSDKFQR